MNTRSNLQALYPDLVRHSSQIEAVPGREVVSRGWSLRLRNAPSELDSSRMESREVSRWGIYRSQGSPERHG